MRMMIDAELNKRYSIEGLLTWLEKIKIMVWPNGEKMTLRYPRNSAKSWMLFICVPKRWGGQVGD
ncbi:hypothetical protein P0O15_06685 [Methanotrichaceae archaeon Mx]|uniref:Uncharacterized protein n=2 Tax=Candidatus Methanocrinis natronophilus TaxID=3033396 RepID=A0ABT5X840_9EURY|nr:hypothetical protein [Candidatus Methanocrinis natronophilus]